MGVANLYDKIVKKKKCAPPACDIMEYHTEIGHSNESVTRWTAAARGIAPSQGLAAALQGLHNRQSRAEGDQQEAFAKFCSSAIFQ